MGDKTRGVYNKFQVERTDGQTKPGGKHEFCDHFVLDITCDPFARVALKSYATACAAEYPLLSADLFLKLHEWQRDDDDRQEVEADAMGYTHERQGCASDCPVCFPPTGSEIARQIARKLCIEDMIHAHHRSAVAAIIEPEVRELVEENERLKKTLSFATVLYISPCRFGFSNNGWEVQNLNTLQYLGKDCQPLNSEFTWVHKTLDEAIQRAAAVCWIKPLTAALTQSKEPETK